MAMAEPVVPQASVSPDVDVEVQKHEAAMRSGANWFYWIAGLSLVNSVMQLMGSEYGFILGLGITQFIDGIGMAIAGEGASGASLPRVLGFIVNLGVVGFFCVMGWLAGRKHAWAFVLGMVLYLLDAGIFLLVGEWLSLGFHAFALFGIFAGFTALRSLNAMEAPARFSTGVRPIGPGGR